MSFYEEFYRHYDAVFPVGKEKLNFLKDIFVDLPAGAALLDIGCGTGGYTIELGGLGYHVVGIDLEPAMLQQAVEKGKKVRSYAQFKQIDMMNLDSLCSRPCFSGVFSYGNVFAHLRNEQEVSELCRKINGVMHAGTVLAVQIVNYDRVVEHKVRELPTIENKEEGVKLVRRYKHRDDGMIDFSTDLIVQGSDGEKKFANSIPLYPLRSREFLSILSKSGFEQVETFGDFKKSSFKPDESFHLVLKACNKS